MTKEQKNQLRTYDSGKSMTENLHYLLFNEWPDCDCVQVAEDLIWTLVRLVPNGDLIRDFFLDASEPGTILVYSETEANALFQAIADVRQTFGEMICTLWNGMASFETMVTCTKIIIEWLSDHQKAKDQSIADCDFSVRTYGCLTRAGYETVGQLLKLTKSELLQIDKLSAKGGKEILAYAKEHHLEFAAEPAN